MEHFQELSSTKIFSSATEFECQAMMFCFKTRFKTYLKNEPIVNQGDIMDDVVLILKGGANVENMDDLGNISILLQLNKGDIYGLESAYAGDDYYKDTLIANSKTLVLFMNKYRLLNPCENRCKRHELVSKHLMQIVAERNIELMDKLTHLSKKTIREKLLSYFTALSKKANSNYFEIPFNKSELASYLNIDRSAMSTELKRMKEENIIDFEKNEFRLIKK